MTIAVDQPRGLSELGQIVRRLADRRPESPPFIVAVTGSVAAGKSTFAAALAGALDSSAGDSGAGDGGVELVGTDGFLLSNAVLDARGLTLRKGFPESFDAEALGAALARARRGPVTFPGYSHVVYDVDDSLARRIDRPGTLIVEGLGLGPHRASLDALIYLDADEASLEAWYVTRFMALWTVAEHDPHSFYARFRGMDRTTATTFARSVWAGINLPNLREHIIQQRDLADIVVRKGPDHEIIEILEGHGQAGRV